MKVEGEKSSHTDLWIGPECTHVENSLLSDRRKTTKAPFRAMGMYAESCRETVLSCNVSLWSSLILQVAWKLTAFSSFSLQLSYAFAVQPHR